MSDPSTLVRQPQQARSRKTLQRIVAASHRLLEEEGPASLTVGAIARRARTSIGSFYARFDGKEELLRYLGESALQSALGDWSARRDPGKGVAEEAGEGAAGAAGEGAAGAAGDSAAEAAGDSAAHAAGDRAAEAAGDGARKAAGDDATATGSLEEEVHALAAFLLADFREGSLRRLLALDGVEDPAPARLARFHERARADLERTFRTSGAGPLARGVAASMILSAVPALAARDLNEPEERVAQELARAATRYLSGSAAESSAAESSAPPEPPQPSGPEPPSGPDAPAEPVDPFDVWD